MDKIIDFYLREEPVLYTIPTKSFYTDDKERRARRRKERKERGGEGGGRGGGRGRGRRRWKAEGRAGEGEGEGEGGAKEDLISFVFDNPEVQKHVVVKRVDGRGGDAVWVGPKISREEFVTVKEIVAKEPAAFIVQKCMGFFLLFCWKEYFSIFKTFGSKFFFREFRINLFQDLNLSQVDGQLVDLRYASFFLPGLVSPRPLLPFPSFSAALS
jgi:hypothetical protein